MTGSNRLVGSLLRALNAFKFQGADKETKEMAALWGKTAHDLHEKQTRSASSRLNGAEVHLKYEARFVEDEIEGAEDEIEDVEDEIEGVEDKPGGVEDDAESGEEVCVGTTGNEGTDHARTPGFRAGRVSDTIHKTQSTIPQPERGRT
ncbi:hypothetical protein NLI96_g7885 [Meripilus lineatus]|uniref:Uncharacterized protein n=1 Tax=Meripilus lineatus TaxID=2056292 RepID=A0AAD5UYJ4_9APHY|nr:hypothetical protein NLI96_g7885 [Physisporinus lineatus]